MSFITNNVKEMQSFKKRLKLIKYSNWGILTVVLFLQETHYDSKVKQNWKEDFKCQVSFFFFLQKDKLLWRFNCYCRMETFTVKNKKKIKKVVF